MSGEDFIRSEARDPESRLSRALKRSCLVKLLEASSCYVAHRDVASVYEDKEILVFAFNNLDSSKDIGVSIKTVYTRNNTWDLEHVVRLSGSPVEAEIKYFFGSIRAGRNPFDRRSYTSLADWE